MLWKTLCATGLKNVSDNIYKYSELEPHQYIHASTWIEMAAGCLVVSRCHTKVESDESNAYKLQNIQTRGSTLALKLRVYVTRSPRQGYQWLLKKDCCLEKLKKKLTECNNNCIRNSQHTNIEREGHASVVLLWHHLQLAKIMDVISLKLLCTWL